MKTHNDSVHEKKVSLRYKCDRCEVSFTKMGRLKSHISSVHEKIKPFKCENCDYLCSTKGVMKQHVKSIHIKTRPFKCEICDREFGKKSGLKFMPYRIVQ